MTLKVFTKKHKDMVGSKDEGQGVVKSKGGVESKDALILQISARKYMIRRPYPQCTRTYPV